jgi:putative endonuclease
MDDWYVYILECSDGTLYTGITNNIPKRIAAHNNGAGAKYTKGRGPVKLIRQFGPFSKSEASKLEYKIKQLSREEKLKYEQT